MGDAAHIGKAVRIMKLAWSLWVSLSVTLLALMLTTNVAIASQDSDILELWVTHDENSVIDVSHDAWQGLLDKYLDSGHASGVNRFNYAGVSKLDRAALNMYLKSLQELDPQTLTKDEQLAYWINFYNALTVQIVLQKYPVASIRSIRFLTSPFGPWGKKMVKVQGQRLSLNDIEHEILRPIWQDPRIHFAVNCASIGCPNLADQAFTATNVYELMNTAAHDFINHARGVEIQGDTLVLSSIFDWYGVDFGENESEVVEHLSSFYDGDVLTLKNLKKIVYQYNWALNRP